MTTPGLRRLTAAVMLVALCAVSTACAQGAPPNARELMQLNQEALDRRGRRDRGVAHLVAPERGG